MPDLEPFVSPIDGSIISGRAAMAAHFKQHGVTNMADYKESWAKAAEQRASATVDPRLSEERKRFMANHYKEFKNYGQYKRYLEKLGRG